MRDDCIWNSFLEKRSMQIAIQYDESLHHHFLLFDISMMGKQQYTSCMNVGTGGNLGVSREYHNKLFGPLFYTCWNCPLSSQNITQTE